MPVPNPASLSVGASALFTVYLGCWTPGFSLNGKNWTAVTSVQVRDSYWARTLRLNSKSSATFRNPAGDLLRFVPAPASAYC